MQTLCCFQSLRWLDTGIAVLLFYTFPVMTLGVERFFFKQQVARSALLCVIVIFVGAALIAVQGLHNGTIDPRGLAWAVPGPVIYAFYLAADARLMARHPPLIGAGFLYGGLAAAYLGAVLWLGASLPKSARGWLPLAFLALGPGAVAAVSQSYSVPRLGPATYAIIANCELVTVVVVGATVLGEELTPTRVLGGADPRRYPVAWVGAQAAARSNCRKASYRGSACRRLTHREVPDGRMAALLILNSQRLLSRFTTAAQH